MRYIKQAKLQQIKQHIKKGGVIAYATEFCYGLGCDPYNYRAVAKILKIKKRSKAKGMILISAQRNFLNRIVKVDINSAEFNDYWPGSYSIVLPVKKCLPQNLTGIHETIAVRVTRHQQVKQLSNYLHMPLVSTSANISGHKAIRNYRDCVRKFGRSVMVIAGDTNYASKPSTIIDWQTRKILR